MGKGKTFYVSFDHFFQSAPASIEIFLQTERKLAKISNFTLLKIMFLKEIAVTNSVLCEAVLHEAYVYEYALNASSCFKHL